MPRYRLKPLAFDAVRKDTAFFAGGEHGQAGDWLITDDKGEAAVWPDVLFKETCEPADAPTEQWEYESAGVDTIPEMNEWGARGWQIYQIDLSVKPYSVFMRRRVEPTYSKPVTDPRDVLRIRLEPRGLRALERALWALYPGKCRSALGDLTGSMPKPADGWLTMEVLVAAVEYGADLNRVFEQMASPATRGKSASEEGPSWLEMTYAKED